MNSYFVEHPEMILVEMKMVSGRFGPEATCVPYEGADLADQLSEAVPNIHGELTAYEVEDELAEEMCIRDRPGTPLCRACLRRSECCRNRNGDFVRERASEGGDLPCLLYTSRCV